MSLSGKRRVIMEKFLSRKFIISLAGIISVIVGYNIAEEQAVIISGGLCALYIVVQGIVDAIKK